jgi:hypothetical protein
MKAHLLKDHTRQRIARTKSSSPINCSSKELNGLSIYIFRKLFERVGLYRQYRYWVHLLPDNFKDSSHHNITYSSLNLYRIHNLPYIENCFSIEISFHQSHSNYGSKFKESQQNLRSPQVKHLLDRLKFVPPNK